jgi:hypothetical protein
MAKTKPVDAMSKIVAILEPLPSEERTRVMGAAMMLLGEAQPHAASMGGAEAAADDTIAPTNLSPRARAWMKQNGVTSDEIQQVFHVAEGVADILVNSPGKNKKEQTLNMYVLTGISQLLARGEPIFDDKTAREHCRTAGCYDPGNHSFYLKGKGNLFTNTKDKWTLTSPGLKCGAEIIKELTKQTG